MASPVQYIKRMYRQRRALFWATLGILVLIGSVLVTAPRLRSDTDDAIDNDEATAVSVEVSSVIRRDIHQVTRVAGRIAPSASIDLTPKMAAQVEHVYVEMGDPVSRGDQLVRLDDSDVRSQLRAAEAALEAARAQVAQVERGARALEIEQLESAVEASETAVETAQWFYERTERLYEVGAVSRPQYEESRAQYESAKSQLTMAQLNLDMAIEGADNETLRMARARVGEAEAAVQRLRRVLDDMVIKSPIDGLVSYVLIDAGEMVGTATGTVGVVSVDEVRVEALVSEKVVGSVQRGDDIEVEIAAIGETRVGEVIQVAPAADPNTGMFPVIIALDNPDHECKPGMLAEVLFIVDRAEGVLSIPRRALITRGDEEYVFVVEDEMARRRPVRVGLTDEDYVEITSGLNEGERVVDYGVHYVEDGSDLEIIERR